MLYFHFVLLLKAALRPYSLILGVLGCITIQSWRLRSASRFSPLKLTIPVALLGALSWYPVEVLAVWPLRSHYPRLSEVPADAQAIVVLGGDESNSRLDAAERLWRLRPDLPIVPTGCSFNSLDPTDTAAGRMRQVLIGHGVPPERILPEPRSQTTDGDAREVARMAAARGWIRIVLVTGAEHLPRSVACFRRQGLVVYPSPAYSFQLGWNPSRLVPDVEALRHTQDAFHEYLGLLWYRIMGRI